MTARSSVKVAENEATFREANEHIERRARELDFTAAVPLLCECGEPECRETLRLTFDEYEAVRREATHFFVVPGHESEADPDARVIERHETHWVVEKIGVAGEVADRRDPRQTA